MRSPRKHPSRQEEATRAHTVPGRHAGLPPPQRPPKLRPVPGENRKDGKNGKYYKKISPKLHGMMLKRHSRYKLRIQARPSWRRRSRVARRARCCKGLLAALRPHLQEKSRDWPKYYSACSMSLRWIGGWEVIRRHPKWNRESKSCQNDLCLQDWRAFNFNLKIRQRCEIGPETVLRIWSRFVRFFSLRVQPDCFVIKDIRKQLNLIFKITICFWTC